MSMQRKTHSAALFFTDSFPENKQTVLLLHGLGSDSSSWIFQVNELGANGFRPIALDIPGFGQSTYPRARWTSRSAALMIIDQLIDKIDGEMDVLGLSMGGVIAQQLARFRPKKIGKMILASTFSHLRPSVRKTLPYLSKRFEQVFLGDIRSQAVTVADRIFPDGNAPQFHDYLVEQIRNANPKIYRQAMVSLASFNSMTWMRKWDKPVLIVTGSEDTTVTLKNQRVLAGLLKNERQVVITGAGHAVTIDHKEQFNRAMIDFLKEKRQ